MAQDFLKNDLIVKGYVSASTILSSTTNLLDIFVKSSEYMETINTVFRSLSSYYLSLSGGSITGSVFLTGSVFADAFNSSNPSLMVLDTTTLPADSVIDLPLNFNDLELTATNVMTISSFVNGIKGTLYTLTNKGTDSIYILNNETITLRTNLTSIELPVNASCSLRADVDNCVSIW